MIKAKSLMNEHRPSKGWLRCFMRRNGLSLRRITNTSFMDPDRKEIRIAKFYSDLYFKMKDNSFSKRLINMDETRVELEMPINRTLEKIGSKHV
jgi:hypothetical protein